MNKFAFVREKSLPSLAKILLVATLATTLSACGVLGDKMPWAEQDPVDYSLISTNLVDAISQYPRLSPQLATVQVTKPDNAFERQVHKEMRQQGFKLESGDDVQGVNGVNAVVRGPEADLSGSEALYILSIGGISAERKFETVDGRTVPSSELILRGGDERTVTLNDPELFDGFDSAFSKVAFMPLDAVVISEVPKAAVATRVPSESEGKLPPIVKRNMYETRESNFSSIYTDYEDVEKKILIFPNDSLRLGETNKRIIERYVSMMEPETDVLSVIGCSHGKTAISNGNSLLALGRANRVKEAFLFSGIEHDSVMEEGCWAPRHFDEMMPRRGVVLTLKRLKPS